MNILFLIFSFNTGGIERLIIDMCNYMTKSQQNVSLCVINNDYETDLLAELSPSVKLYLLDRPKADSKKAAYMHEFSHIIYDNHIQILHCHGLNCVMFSLLAKLRTPKIKILNTVHDVNNFPRYSALQVFAYNILCSHSIAISDTVKKEILQCRIPSRKVTRIYNAIDTDKFRLSVHPHMNHLGICEAINHNDPIVLGSVARIIPEKKGQKVLLEAVKQLISIYPNIKCLFAGGIALHHEKAYQELLDYVSENHLENHIEFMGNVKDIPAFLTKLDIFVLPSFYEGFGISLIEAMATGLPCIASALDGPAEIINQNTYGTLFPVGDSTALAAAISMQINNYSLWNGKTGADYIYTHFSMNEMVKKHCELYQYNKNIPTV